MEDREAPSYGPKTRLLSPNWVNTALTAEFRMFSLVGTCHVDVEAEVL